MIAAPGDTGNTPSSPPFRQVRAYLLSTVAKRTQRPMLLFSRLPSDHRSGEKNGRADSKIFVYVFESF